MISGSRGIEYSVFGRVQGVGFRYFVQDIALKNGLTGWVQNALDGSVDGYAHGSVATIEIFIEMLHEGPLLSRVDRVVVNDQPAPCDEKGFAIRA